MIAGDHSQCVYDVCLVYKCASARAHIRAFCVCAVLLGWTNVARGPTNRVCGMNGQIDEVDNIICCGCVFFSFFFF